MSTVAPSQRRQRGSRYARALYRLLQALQATSTVPGVLEATLQEVVRALNAHGSCVFLLSPDRETFLPWAAHGLSDGFIRKGPLRLDETLSSVLAGETLTIENTSVDPRLQYPEATRREGVGAIASVPLRLHGKVLGMVRVYLRQARAFTPQELEFLRAAAALVSLALERVRAAEMLRPDAELTEEDLLAWYRERGTVRLEAVRPVSFAHPSEAEFARLLDFYKIRWEYEPRSFPLRWEGDRPVEMLTPDFYLPDLDLYIELTTLKQSLVTRKNRKIRRFRELYPDLNIILLYRRDYAELLAKYGYAPLDEEEGRLLGRVVYSAQEIQERVAALGQQITADYSGRSPVFIGVLKGVACFMTDLMRETNLPLEVDFLALSPYGAGEGGPVHFLKDVTLPLRGRDVVVIEDIVDTGLTLRYLLEHLKRHEPASLEVCVLLDKRARRLVDLPLRYIGFDAPDEYLVGYGLDYREKYRNLPFIAALKKHVPRVVHVG